MTTHSGGLTTLLLLLFPGRGPRFSSRHFLTKAYSGYLAWSERWQDHQRCEFVSDDFHTWPFLSSIADVSCRASSHRFAVPFEEDERDPKTWFLDLDYIDSMWEMFRKVNGEFLSKTQINVSMVSEMICPWLWFGSQGTPHRLLPHWTPTPLFRSRNQ